MSESNATGTPVATSELTPWLGDRPIDAWLDDFERDGYLVFDRVLDDEQINAIRAAITPHCRNLGRNHFEGFHTNRVYALMAKAPEVFAPLVTHPLALWFAERELGESCLLSALLAIDLQPGESAQGWHYDDAQIRLPRPRPALGVSTFWAIDATHADNGATEVIPGSHHWGDEELRIADAFATDAQSLRTLPADADLQPRDDAVSVSLNPGSLMIAKGTLWHRGGGNRTDAGRLIVTPQYCPGWARQLENMVLAVPPKVAREVPPRARQLLGYNIHDVFMGYVDGRHPDSVLQID
ncbi:MAG: phytanoyl-CoA dioxygenase family protein [Pseudomonadota bacterium]